MYASHCISSPLSSYTSESITKPSLFSQVTAWNINTTASITQLWSSALQTAPAVQSALWSNPAENSQQQSLSITTQAPDSVSSLLEKALKLILSDVPTFLAFAGEGRFTTDVLPTIPAGMLGPDFDIGTGVATFVTSKLMQEGGYYGVPMGVVDEATFIASTTTAQKSEGENTYYWSPSTHRQYRLMSKGGSKAPMDVATLMDHIEYDG
ncbi:MAG: hypothetical protein L6R39_007685, partial [Caloplaca ligustica]